MWGQFESIDDGSMNSPNGNNTNKNNNNNKNAHTLPPIPVVNSSIASINKDTSANNAAIGNAQEQRGSDLQQQQQQQEKEKQYHLSMDADILTPPTQIFKDGNNKNQQQMKSATISDPQSQKRRLGTAVGDIDPLSSVKNSSRKLRFKDISDNSNETGDKDKYNGKSLLTASSASSTAGGNGGMGVKSCPSCPDFGSLEAAQKRVISSGLTISEAKGELWKLRISGVLIKKGFRHRKLWVSRWIVLAGRILSYYESADDEKIGKVRGSLELSKETLVEEIYPSTVDIRSGKSDLFEFIIYPKGKIPMQANNPRAWGSIGGNDDGLYPTGNESSTSTTSLLHDGKGEKNQKYGLDSPPISNANSSNQPSNNNTSSTSFLDIASWFRKSSDEVNLESDTLWIFRANSEEERNMWIKGIRKSIALVRRVEVAPTLVGVGSVHDHYDIGKVIGKGKFGLVRLGIAKQTGQEYAIKVMNKSKNIKTDTDAKVLKNEIRIMRKVTRQHDHPNICKLFQAYEDSFMVYLVMEPLLGGSLLERVTKNGTYDEAKCAHIMYQLSDALNELHSSGIILCDIRPETLLFASPNSDVVKIVEFGRALLLPAAPTTNLSLIPSTSKDQASKNQSSFASYVTNSQLLGMPGYISPEVISHRQYSTLCDMWSLGCTMYFVLSGYPAFVAESTDMTLKRSVQGIQQSKLQQQNAWKTKSDECISFLMGLLSVDRTRRLSASDALAHPWINKFVPTSMRRQSEEQDLETSSPVISESDNNESFYIDDRLKEGANQNDKVDSFISQKKNESMLGKSSIAKYSQDESALTMSNELRNKSNISQMKGSKSQPNLQRMGELSFAGKGSMKRSLGLYTPPSVSEMEARNEHFALDARAEKVRASKSLLHSIDEHGNHIDPLSPSSSDLEFFGGGIGTGIGVRSVAIEDDKYFGATKVREIGPFLSALESQLRMEAGVLGSTNSLPGQMNSSSPSLASLDDSFSSPMPSSSGRMLVNHAVSESDAEKKMKLMKQ